MFINSISLFAQEDTCNCSKNKPIVMPIILIGVGTINFLDGSIDHSIRTWRNEHYPTFRYKLDDYMQYTPLLASYALNLAGMKGKHNYKDLTLYSVSSLMVSGGIVQGLKYAVGRERPDMSNNRSFPSGHTQTAFCFATVLHKEFGKKNKWISVAGYTVATATGAMRMMNNKHWFSDVCTGAGIGILSTELTYRLLDRFYQKKKVETKKPFF